MRVTNWGLCTIATEWTNSRFSLFYLLIHAWIVCIFIYQNTEDFQNTPVTHEHVPALSRLLVFTPGSLWRCLLLFSVKIVCTTPSKGSCLPGVKDLFQVLPFKVVAAQEVTLLWKVILMLKRTYTNLFKFFYPFKTLKQSKKCLKITTKPKRQSM